MVEPVDWLDDPTIRRYVAEGRAGTPGRKSDDTTGGSRADGTWGGTLPPQVGPEVLDSAGPGAIENRIVIELKGN